MKIINQAFNLVLLLEPKIFEDARGFFIESYNQQVFSNLGINDKFLQDNHSLSKESGILRGMHYQINPRAQAKLVRVISGAIYDVVIDIRRDSSTFGKWESFILTSENKRQLYVPKGFAHGFCTLTANTEVIYKVDEYYSPQHDRGILWNDPAIGIDWPVSNPVLSAKDEKLPVLEEAEINYV